MNINLDYVNNIQIKPLLETLRLQKIDDAEYFSKKYSSYISNSRLSLIDPNKGNDPKAFFEGLSKHNVYSDVLLFGSAVHCLFLQPELFHLCLEVDRPTAKAGFMADELYSIFTNNTATPKDKESAIYEASAKIGYYKDKLDNLKIKSLLEKCIPYWKARKKYESNNLLSTPIYLDPKNKDRLKNCINALQTNEAIVSLLHPQGFLQTPISENEQAILLDVEVSCPNSQPFILKLKAKLDNYTIDLENNTVIVNDVKTIGKIVSEFETNFETFNYYRELAIYSWLISLVASKYYNLNNCTIKSNCLVVSTIPQYYTKVYEVTKRDFIKGWNEFKFLLKLVAYYYNEGYRFE